MRKIATAGSAPESAIPQSEAGPASTASTPASAAGSLLNSRTRTRHPPRETPPIGTPTTPRKRADRRPTPVPSLPDLRAAALLAGGACDCPDPRDLQVTT